MPAVGSYRVLPEKLLRGDSTLGLDVAADDRDGLLVGCVMVAIGPITGIEDLIFAEDIPQRIEPFLGEG